MDPHRFVFDLDRGILDQVVEKLERSPLLALEKGVGPRVYGVYALYYRGDLAYIGLTKNSLRSRLSTHRLKIEKRQNITLAEVRCRYLTFDGSWWAAAAEAALIEHYDPKWNHSGFGSNAPGSGRPGIRVNAWNEEFPPKGP